MLLINQIEHWLKNAVDLLIPRQCIVCGRQLLGNEHHLCIYCESDLPLTHFWNSPANQMADRLNDLIQRHLVSEMERNKRIRDDSFKSSCGDQPVERSAEQDIKRPRLPYLYATALFFYHGDAGYRKIPQRVKYDGDRAAGRYYGSILGQFIRESEYYKDIDTIVPIPLHWTRQWSRGYNQAEIIAKSISRQIGAGVRTDILSRIKHTRTQTVLSVKQKAANVQNAFSISRRFLKEERTCCSSLRKTPRHILLVDDVFTTGATMASCCIALYRHFGYDIRISAASLGFVNQG